MDYALISNVVLAYIPHGHCYLWNTDLVSLHAISDALIALAYFSIPCTLGYFLFKRKDLPYPEIFALFGVFIISCGITHIFEIWTLWYPAYWLSGSVKALTAVVSVLTAIELFPIVPQALALASPAELEATNLTLKHEIEERRQIEVKLHRSQQLLDNAFEFALIGSALVTLEGDWIKVNPALCKLLGYPASEILQTNFRDITYPDDLEADQAYIHQLLSQEIDACQFEKRFIHKQGHIIWSLLSVSLGRDLKEQPINFIVQIQDITERKQAEQSLRSMNEQLELAVKKRTAALEKANTRLKQSRAKYQDLYDNAPDMYASIDSRSKKIVRCNQTLINELGYSKQEILGRPVFDIYYSDCLPKSKRAFQSFAKTGEVNDAQLILQRKDGSKLHVSLNARAVRNQAEKILYSRLSWRDITKRKQLEDELQQVNAELEQRVQKRTQELHVALESLEKSQKQLELSLEASGNASWNWHILTGDSEWSPTYFQMLGYEKDELPAGYETWANLVHPEDISRVKEILKAHLQDGSIPYAFDYRMLTKSGKWKWISNLGKVVERDAQGQPVFMAGMHQDINDRKQVEQQLKKLNTELVRSNQELSQFAYVASHDLQEPLRKIRSFSDLLAKAYQGQLDETADRYINYITSGATRMQGLIDDLLSFSRVGRTKLNTKETDLETLLMEVISDLGTVIEQSNAVVKVEPLPTLLVDPGQIRQVLQNLISNAIKYCQAEQPTVHLWATEANGNWTISVQDNGIGIDPQFSDRIFIIFQRLHHREEFSGTGIGLAICKKIVERHGGQIWVDSQKEQGSTFSFTLPMNCDIHQ